MTKPAGQGCPQARDAESGRNLTSRAALSLGVPPRENACTQGARARGLVTLFMEIELAAC